jgi:predicted ester cyclase
MREPTVEEAANSQLTENLLEAENGRDDERLFSAVSEDVVLHRPVFAVGRPALRRLVERVFTAFPDHRRDTLELHAVGPFVVVRWRFSGTNLGPWGDHAPTGAAIDVKGASLLEFESLRLVSAWCYVDSASAAQQLGAASTLLDLRAPTLALT